MTYQVIRGSARFDDDPQFPHHPYLVEKILKAGEAYTIATFRSRDDALKCLHTLRASDEVRRGALVTEAL